MALWRQRPRFRLRPHLQWVLWTLSLGMVVGLTVLGHPDARTMAAWTDSTPVSGTAVSTGALAAPTSASVSQSCVAEATPTLRSGAGGTSLTTGTTSGTLTIAKPTSAATGDVLLAAVLAVGNYSTTSPSAPAGWTPVRLDGANQGGQFVYTHVVDASEPSSYSWTGLIGDASGGIGAFSGVDTATPVNVSSSAQDNDQGTVTAPSVTTTRANVRLIGLFGGGGLANHTAPPSMTTVWSGFSPAGTSILAAQESWPTPGPTGARVATGPGAQSIGQLIALQPPVNPYVTTTWTPSSSTYATAQDFRRTDNGVLQVQATLASTASSRTGGPLVTGVSYTVSVAATFNNWVSASTSASFTGRSCP